MRSAAASRAGLFVLCLCGTLSAQTAVRQSTDDQQRTTFRSSVDVVAVDVSVVDPSGRPIGDLTADEFTLKVDGRLRRIRSAEFVSLRGVNEPPPTEGYSTNKGQRPGRLIVLVVDQANIRRGAGKEAMRAAAEFVGGLNRSDRVALYLLPGAGPVVDFSSNHTYVKAMLERGVGQELEGERSGKIGIAEAIALSQRDDQQTWSDVVERECAGEHDAVSLEYCRSQLRAHAREIYNYTRQKTRSFLIGLRDIVERLAKTDEPKTVVLVSEGLVLERGTSDLAWVASRTAAAHATFFGIRLSAPQYDAMQVRTSPSRERDAALLTEGMEQLIGEAKGDLLPVAVNPLSAFTRLATELSGHYLLSFEPELGDRDGREHEIAVQVRRRDAIVRARRQFSAEPAGTVRPLDDILAETLRSALMAADFDLKVTTFSFRDDATDRIKLIVGTEFERTFNPSGVVALAYQILDEAGTVRGTDLQKALLPAKGQDGRPQSYLSAVVLDPGTYTVKVVAVDASGRRASVERTVDAKITSIGQLRLGELMLTETKEGEPVRPIVDGRVESRTLNAYVEIYSAAEPELQQTAVTLEIASNADGPALVTAAVPLNDGTPGKRIAKSALPLSVLRPGKYVCRAVLSARGRAIARTMRPFNIDELPASAKPTAGTPSAPTVPFTSAIERFDRRGVLTRPVLGFFIDRLGVAGIPPLPASLTPAIGYLRMGQFTEVRRIVATAGVDHVVGSFMAGVAELAHGELDTAVAKLTNSLRGAPSFFPAVFYLGACYAAAGLDREAVLVWRSAVVADPAAPWVFTLLADAQLRLGDAAPAMEVMREATRLWPDDDDVRMRWAVALAGAGQGHAAAKALAPYLARHTSDEPRLLLGMRLIYEARVMNTPIESVEADRAAFLRYFDAYSKTAATAIAQATEWRRLVDR